MATISAIAAVGCGRVGIQFWRWDAPYPNGYTLKGLVDYAHLCGLVVDACPMVNGPSAVRFVMEPLEKRDVYRNWLLGEIAAVTWKAGDTCRLWNEIPALWGTQMNVLYAGLGNDLVRAFPPILTPVLPGPRSERPQDYIAAFGGQLSMQLPTQRHALCVHVYKVDGLADVAIWKLEAVRAVAVDQGRMMMIGEFGGTNAPQFGNPEDSPEPIPDPVFYGAIAKWAASRGIPALAHQAVDPGDGFAVLGHSGVLAAMGLAPMTVGG